MVGTDSDPGIRTAEIRIREALKLTGLDPEMDQNGVNNFMVFYFSPLILCILGGARWKSCGPSRGRSPRPS